MSGDQEAKEVGSAQIQNLKLGGMRSVTVESVPLTTRREDQLSYVVGSSVSPGVYICMSTLDVKI